MIPNTYVFHAHGNRIHLSVYSENMGFVATNPKMDGLIKVLPVDLAPNASNQYLLIWENDFQSPQVVTDEFRAAIVNAIKDIYMNRYARFPAEKFWLAVQDWAVQEVKGEQVFAGSAINLGSGEREDVLMVCGPQNNESLLQLKNEYEFNLIFGLNSFGEDPIPEVQKPSTHQYRGQTLTLEYCQVSHTGTNVFSGAIVLNVSRFEKDHSDLVPYLKDEVRKNNKMSVIVTPDGEFGVIHYLNGEVGSLVKIYPNLPTQYDDPDYSGAYAILY